MKAQNFRIGNLLIHGETIVNVKIIYDTHFKCEDEYCVSHGNSIQDNFKPIPLNEKWLLKFGWVWNKECNSYEKYPNGDARMHLTKIDVNNSYTMFNYVLKATIAKRIWYVHQLQNLYFALTGKELIIKTIKNEQKDTTD